MNIRVKIKDSWSVYIEWDICPSKSRDQRLKDSKNGITNRHTIYGDRPQIDMQPRIWTDNITNEMISGSV